LDSAVADAYRRTHGKELNVVSALCYDAIIAIAQSIDATGKDDPDRIRQYLETTDGVSGATGKFSFDTNHDAVRDMAIKTVKNGQFIVKGK